MVATPWRLDRSISIGDLVVFTTLALAGVGYIVSQDRRQTIVEVKVQDLEAGGARGQAGLEARMDRIEAKLDRVIESRNGTNNR